MWVPGVSTTVRGIVKVAGGNVAEGSVSPALTASVVTFPQVFTVNMNFPNLD